jgi:hypothetical protein
MDNLKQGSTPRPHSPQYTPGGSAQAAQKAVAEPEEVIKTCGSWSDFFRCPLVIYSVLAFIFFVADIWAIYQAQKNNVVGTSFWITALLSLLIYLILIFAFGYWIKKKCVECKTAQSWLVFLLAIFFPIILGFIVNVLVGAFAGGLSYLSQSFGGGGSNGKAKKQPPSPLPGAAGAAAAGSPAPLTTGAAVAGAQNPVLAGAAVANQQNALSNALGQLAGVAPRVIGA